MARRDHDSISSPPFEYNSFPIHVSSSWTHENSWLQLLCQAISSFAKVSWTQQIAENDHFIRVFNTCSIKLCWFVPRDVFTDLWSKQNIMECWWWQTQWNVNERVGIILLIALSKRLKSSALKLYSVQSHHREFFPFPFQPD